MKLFRLPIYTETSPNMQWDDIFVVLKTLAQPWSWNKKKYANRFEKEIKSYLRVKHVHLNDSGRTSLNLSLKALGVTEGDEVIMPSFTCLVVANAVRWTGATPVYLDTREADYNAEYELLAEKISEKTKVVLVQHTFGKMVPVEMVKKLIERVQKEKGFSQRIFIVEDWAHAMKRDQELVGDMAFLTFGIEKLISTIRGGAVITNDVALSKKLAAIHTDLQTFPISRVIVGLLNPLFWWVDVPLHKIGYKRYTIGAAVRIIWRKLGFLGIMIEKIENRSIKPDWYPAKISPALSRLGSNQLKKLDVYNAHRSKLAELYYNAFKEFSDESDEFDPGRTYIRYPILLRSLEEKSEVWEAAKALKVTLGAWFKTPLYATYVTKEAFDKLCFVPAETPRTVEKCKTVLNLPTSVNMSEKRAKELVEVLKTQLTP